MKKKNYLYIFHININKKTNPTICLKNLEQKINKRFNVTFFVMSGVTIAIVIVSIIIVAAIVTALVLWTKSKQNLIQAKPLLQQMIQWRRRPQTS